MENFLMVTIFGFQLIRINPIGGAPGLAPLSVLVLVFPTNPN